MNSTKKRKFNVLKGTLFLFVPVLLGSCKKLVVLDPKGPVGMEQAFLIKVAFLLMLIVVLPVFVMVVLFSVRYRASNKKANYQPKWAHSNAIEAVVWGVPVAIIIALAYLTYTSTHNLNPYKPLVSENKPLKVDVISTDSDWLFIYPEYGIASINKLVFPVNTPLNFRLTSGSVMTSMFIPALGSQMYAMAGMQTKLHLMASEEGEFEGKNMEYSGNGYAGMHFKAISTSFDGFEDWMKEVKASPETLNLERFNQINQMLNINHPVTVFSSVEKGLFNKVMMENMQWMSMPKHSKIMENMESEHDETMDMHHMHGSGQGNTVNMEE